MNKFKHKMMKTKASVLITENITIFFFQTVKALITVKLHHMKCHHINGCGKYFIKYFTFESIYTLLLTK